MFKRFINKRKLKKIINSSDNIVVFTGAGISTDSGIPDFRSKNNGVNFQEILSSSFFYKYPKEFYDYFRENKLLLKDINPNKTHYWITQLENNNKVKAIITQNIDGLHEKSGSKNVIDLHGNFLDFNCVSCEEYYTLEEVDLLNNVVPFCKKCNNLIKPNIVLYEEHLPENKLFLAAEYLKEAETLIVLGTSLLVNPAASLLKYFNGKNFIIINKQKTMFDKYATLVINDNLKDII